MALQGTLLVEEFAFALDDVELPLINLATGQPTGETAKRKVLKIQTIDTAKQPTLLIEIRMTDEHFDMFKGAMEGRTHVPVAPVGALKALPDFDSMFGNPSR